MRTDRPGASSMALVSSPTQVSGGQTLVLPGFQRTFPLLLKQTSLSSSFAFQKKPTALLPPYKTKASAEISSHTPRRCVQIISCAQSRKLELSGRRKKTRQAEEPRLRANHICRGSAASPHMLGVPGEGSQRGEGLRVLRGACNQQTPACFLGGEQGWSSPCRAGGLVTPPRPTETSPGATNPPLRTGRQPWGGT